MPKIKKVPFQFSNEIKDGKHILTLSGNVQKKYWRDDEVIDAKTIRETLDAVSQDIIIKLNSPGGDVFEGIEIYNYLKSHPSNISVEVTGLAASAATFILAGASEVIMNTGTSIMIHEAATFAWGNKKELQKSLNALETIDESIISIYSEQTGQSVDQLRTWMEEEKWFKADEAVEFGFATKVASDNSGEEDHDLESIIAAAVEAKFVALQAEQQNIDLGTFDTKTVTIGNLKKTKSLLEKLRKEEN